MISRGACRNSLPEGSSVKMSAWSIVLVLHIIIMQSTAVAQVEIAQSKKAEDEAAYQVDAISFASSRSAQSRMDVFVKVPYENLSFVQRDGQYYASYEMTINVSDSTGRLANEQLWTEEVKAETFEESVSSHAYSLTQRVFEVSPGRYSIVTVLRDNETNVSNRLVRQLTVSDYSTRSFSLSDIMLLSRLSLEDEKKIIVPNVSPNVGGIPDAFYVFFEVYNDPDLDSVVFVTTILNDSKEQVLDLDTGYSLTHGRNQIFIRIDNTNLALGDYTLYIRAFPLDSSGNRNDEYIAATSRSIAVRWRGIPKGVKDLDLAIDQMQYIAESGELDDIRAAETSEEKQKRFLEFWKKRDPNPNTLRNEEMEEYFAKVEYANKHFRHYIDGWRTDMGMVYIIFGSPNNVDRHPFDIDSKPYEVWSYYELNHQFVFVDQTGFGDYRLTTPIWEIWKRPQY